MERRGLISLFARHRVAANLLMLIMLLAGSFALMRLNVQFLPTFDIDIVKVQIVWRGASAEDVERSIINPLEKEFRDIDNVKKMSSTASTGNANISIEFVEGSDMGKALEDVRERVAQVRNLPRDSEEPIITRAIPYERVAILVVTGPDNLSELRPVVRRFERELLDRGIAKIEITGLPEEELAIQIPIKNLVEAKQSLPQIAETIAKRSVDLPAGTIGKSEIGRQLRSLSQKRSIKEFEQLPIFSDEQGERVLLGDIATIERRPLDNEVATFYRGKPAVEIKLLRTENSNAFDAANILTNWLKEVRPTLGKSLHIHVYDQQWSLIKERIDLLLKNGVGGLILIVIILYLLLNRKVATWVLIGIPTSFMAGLAILFAYGGSINMVSLFALIMSLGIIVDDTIVIGEQALTNINFGMKPLAAIEDAAYKMLAPIMSSSLTTVCAFLPLLLISGIIGTILFAIPMVVICVIIASVIECFLVLPGHLHHSFKNYKHENEPALRQTINYKFAQFRDHRFRRLITWSLLNRGTVITSVFGLLLLAAGLVMGGYVKFNFFPSPEGRLIQATIQFTVGTPQSDIKKFLQHLNKTLDTTNKELSPEGKNLVETSVSYLHRSPITNREFKRGEQYASMMIELMSPENRNITNDEFIHAWQKRINLPPGIENFSIFAPRGGPPGEDIDIQLSGTSVNDLKKAAVDLQSVLQSVPGTSDVKDDLPYGQEQIIYELNATGSSLGLTTEFVGQQLRAAFNGQIAQIFNEPNEEIEVRVMLPNNERYSLATLEYLPIITETGEIVPLDTVMKLEYRRAPDVILHTDTKLTVHVTSKVDSKINNANRILQQLQADTLPDIINKYNVRVTLRGKAEEQAETFADMKFGLIIGLCLIYIILAWVFSSYGWPFVVMAAIPLGLTGAIFGHFFMGIDLTILSLFGFFGLSGIVVNDSIILLSEYKNLRESGMTTRRAIVDASCLRLRAVLLTSLTTIAGLTPLLFERSLQAQFLIPMAVSITFGLAYATILILVVIPTMLSIYENTLYKFKRFKAKHHLQSMN